MSSERRRIYRTAAGVTPKCLAILRTGSPRSRNSLISCRVDSGSVRGGFPAIDFRRRLACRSTAFNTCVPANRWSGRTQPGVSHEWQTISSPDNSLPEMSHDTRCACAIAPANLNVPYPSRSFAPVHSQHSEPAGLLTFAQNRIWRGSPSIGSPLNSLPAQNTKELAFIPTAG